MATKNYDLEILRLSGPSSYDVVIATWVLADGDDGQPISMPHYPEVTVQVLGNFGTGGAVDLEGTLVKTPTQLSDFFQLHDHQNNALRITSADAKGRFVTEVCRQVRPRISAGSGLSLTFMMLFRRPA